MTRLAPIIAALLMAGCQTTQNTAVNVYPGSGERTIEAPQKMPDSAADMEFERDPKAMSCDEIMTEMAGQPDRLAKAHFQKIPALLLKTGVGYLSGGGGLIANQPWWEMDEQIVRHTMLTWEMLDRVLRGDCQPTRVAGRSE